MVLDFGATHHLTSDATNIADTYNAFLGLDSVTLGNVTSLPINCYGSSSLQPSGFTSIQQLHQLFHTPYVSHSLKSVQCLCLAKGRTRGGLYSLKGQLLSPFVKSTVDTSSICDSVFPFFFLQQ